MTGDIRTRAFIGHDDVVGLNFINSDAPYHFRRHFRQGLRSHVMEVLRPADIDVEKFGISSDGIRRFPRARPIRIFRLFRTRLSNVAEALAEIGRVKLVERYLAPGYLARSNEFIVDYEAPEGSAPLLCGLQEYVEGEILNPWGLLEGDRLIAAFHCQLFKAPTAPFPEKEAWAGIVRDKGIRFVEKIKQMILASGHVPDLAGMGNLMIVRSGTIKLVDINNIAIVSFSSQIELDDKGYPVCDKSIEALANLETKLIGNPIDPADAIYHFFLDPQRRHEVSEKERLFNQKMSTRTRTASDVPGSY